MNIVPTDSPSIFAALNTLVLNGASLAIVRPDNPPPGIAGFLFNVVDEDGAELESDITDHYVEDNTAVQDQIALRPEVVTVTGQIAELVKTVPTAKNVSRVVNPLPLVPGLEPVFSPGAEAQQASAALDVSNRDAYGYIYQLWKGRQRFTVETPWGFFTNMAILSASARQGSASRFVSEFSITFKKIRTASSITVVPGLLAGRAVFQQAPVTQNGTIGQLPVSASQSSQYLSRMTPASP